MSDDQRDGIHYEGKVHPQCGDARLREIRERRRKVVFLDPELFKTSLRAVLDERTTSSDLADLIASAPADIDYLLSELERVREEAATAKCVQCNFAGHEHHPSFPRISCR